MDFLLNRVLNFFFRNEKLLKYFFAIIIVVLAEIVFIGPVDDTLAILLYINKLQEFSNHTILKHQKELVKDFYLKHSNAYPQKFERKKIRKAFYRKKAKMKKEWERVYNLKWILDPYQIKTNEKSVLFDAHHIIPINAGGVNKWWNLTPLSHINHQKLHQSAEEHACFEHNIIYRFFYRLELNIKVKIFNLLHKKYVLKKNNKKFC